MASRRTWTRRAAIAALALAAPAFAFLTLEGLVRGGDAPSSLIETLGRAPTRIGEELRAVGAALHGTSAAAPVPMPPAPNPAPSIVLPPVPPDHVDVPILVYHNIRIQPGTPASHPYDVAPSEFAAQMAALKDGGYVTVSLHDVAAALDGAATLPAKAVVICFDDGRDTQWAEAVPLLERDGFHATFFPFTHGIGRPGYMTWAQLATLVADGDEIGDHTVTHPFFTRLDGAAQRAELEDSKRELASNLGVAVDVFAYPFGELDGRAIAAVKAAGFSVARGLTHGVRQTTGERYALRAYVSTGDIAAFRRILAGTAP